MRNLVAVVGLVLVSLIAACGDDASAPVESTTATFDVARTPILDPGLPEVLLLLTPSGTPEPFDRMCVEISSERRVMDTEEAARMVSRALELLGIEVVDDDCRAALSVTATGGRQMAIYSVGRCWTGWDYGVETVITIDEKVQASWSEDDEQSPPGTIDAGNCTPEGALVLDSNYGHIYLGPVFREMWGNLGHFAIEAARGGYQIPDGLEVTDDVLQLIATRLLAEPITGDFYDELPLWFVLENWTHPSTMGGEPDPRVVALRPLTPYLITLLEREDAALESDAERDAAAYVHISLTLQNLTGQFRESQDLPTPAEWWAWWDSQ
jgi:hypothetical protein